MIPLGDDPSPITHHPSPITHHPSPITHHPSPITHHPSPITHHPSPREWLDSCVVPLRCLLFVVESISLLVFILSLGYHGKLYLQAVNLSTTEDYFVNCFEESFSNYHLSTSYHSDRYYSIDAVDAESMIQGVIFGHKMVGVSSLRSVLVRRSPHHRFCNIRDFPEVIKKANTIATPDSGYSMIILSITTFFWGIYLGLCLLEKRLSTTIGRLISVMILLSLFGVYAFKNAKMGIDSFLVCIWEVMKVSLVSLYRLREDTYGGGIYP